MPKKSFKEANPALQFINTAQDAAPRAEPPPRSVPREAATGGEQAERKSRRLNLLLQPSVLADLTKVAHMRRTSVNDLINEVLKQYNRTQADAIARYDEIFPQG